MTAQTVEPYTIDFDVIHRIAEPRILTIENVLKRLAIMLPIVVLAAVIAGIGTAYIAFGEIETEPAQLIAALTVAASFTVFVGGVVAIAILSWSAFVTQYVATLDAKNELVEMSQAYNFEPLHGKSEVEKAVGKFTTLTTTSAAPWIAAEQEQVDGLLGSESMSPSNWMQPSYLGGPNPVLESDTAVDFIVRELKFKFGEYFALYRPGSIRSRCYRVIRAATGKDAALENIASLVNQLDIRTETEDGARHMRKDQS